MAAGHNTGQAEALTAQCPGWQQAPAYAIDVFTLASARLYDEIARDDPQPFKEHLAAWPAPGPATAKLGCLRLLQIAEAIPDPTQNGQIVS